MFKHSQIELNPAVLRRVSPENAEPRYTLHYAAGAFYRVSPRSWKEIQYIRMLEKRVGYEVPYNGNGLLIRANFMPDQHNDVHPISFD